MDLLITITLIAEHQVVSDMSSTRSTSSHSEAEQQRADVLKKEYLDAALSTILTTKQALTAYWGTLTNRNPFPQGGGAESAIFSLEADTWISSLRYNRGFLEQKQAVYATTVGPQHRNFDEFKEIVRCGRVNEEYREYTFARIIMTIDLAISNWQQLKTKIEDFAKNASTEGRIRLNIAESVGQSRRPLSRRHSPNRPSSSKDLPRRSRSPHYAAQLPFKPRDILSHRASTFAYDHKFRHPVMMPRRSPLRGGRRSPMQRDKPKGTGKDEPNKEMPKKQKLAAVIILKPSNPEYGCYFCSIKGEHYEENCNELKSVRKRIDRIRKDGRCEVCLNDHPTADHILRATDDKCAFCGSSNHHKAICKSKKAQQSRDLAFEAER